MNKGIENLVSGWHDTLSLFYPRICAGCDSVLATGEDILCAGCIISIPVTDSFTVRDNWVEKLFWGRVDIAYAGALCEFRSRTRVQDILHTIKYRQRQEVAVYMGRWLGSYLGGTPFNTCDIIIPVPLHPRRLKTRGFNQSESIAAGIGKALVKPLDTHNLFRRVSNVSQTGKSRYARWDNVSNIFDLRNSRALEGKHILLVDDVITTGATLEASAQVLLSVPGVRVSIVALACAMQ